MGSGMGPGACKVIQTALLNDSKQLEWLEPLVASFLASGKNFPFVKFLMKSSRKDQPGVFVFKVYLCFLKSGRSLSLNDNDIASPSEGDTGQLDGMESWLSSDSLLTDNCTTDAETGRQIQFSSIDDD